MENNALVQEALDKLMLTLTELSEASEGPYIVQALGEATAALLHGCQDERTQSVFTTFHMTTVVSTLMRLKIEDGQTLSDEQVESMENAEEIISTISAEFEGNRMLN